MTTPVFPVCPACGSNTPTMVSLFDGIGGFPLAFGRAGYRVVATVEIDKAAAGVVALQFPDAVHFSDITKVTADDIIAAGFCPVCGVVSAGFPCQDLSLAGRRAGLDGARSGLFFEVVRLARSLRCRWLVLENVPGLLSSVCPCPGNGACSGSDGKRGYYDRPRVRYECTAAHPVRGGACGPGRCIEIHGGAMGAVLGAVAELGYGFAYRVLDAQHFGVPQRRRRVVVVGHLGDDGSAPAAVLLEPEGGDRHPAARRASRANPAESAAGSADGPGVAGLAPTLQGGGKRGYRIDAEMAAGGGLVPAFPLQGTAVSAGTDVHSGPTGPGHGMAGDPMFTLDTRSQHAVAFPVTAGTLTSKTGGGDENDAAVNLLVPQVVNALTRNGITGTDDNTAQGGHLIANTLTRSGAQSQDPEMENLIGVDLAQITSGENRSNPQPGDPQPSLTASGQAAVFQGHGTNVGPMGTLRAGSGTVTGGVPFTVAGEITHALTAEGADASEDGTGRGTPVVAYALRRDPGGTGQGHNTNYVPVPPMAFGHANGMDPQASEAVTPTLRAANGVGGGSVMTSIDWQGGSNQDQVVTPDGTSPTLAHSSNAHAGHHQPKIMQPDAAVRRLTPVECERLQGYPDRWTADRHELVLNGNRWEVVRRSVAQADSGRYRELGNSIAVPVFEWLARRMAAHCRGEL